MTDEPEVFEILRKIRYDLTSAQAKVTEALTTLSNMNLPAPPAEHTCPRCGVPAKSARLLAFHMQNVHGGPRVPLTPEEEAA